MLRAATRILVLVLIATFFTTSAIVPAARSAAIDTTTYLNIAKESTKAELEALVNREDVRKELVALGVDPDDAAARIAALTPEELSMLQGKIDSMPAGADVLVVLGVVLVVLIILEVLGVTNVFTRV
ncbi:MAG: PA2779 family protein [Desulfocapsaceae bacterium]|nr:PA2779 family protein [Desulfocapsaceae bacterium]